jgi:SNF2 family DNA or RNA helicase
MLDENSNLSSDPPGSLINLKKHQLAMLKKLIDIEEKHNVICLCDSPGSGKSYVVLASILWSIVNGKKYTNLIVVPQNIYKQWIDYINTYTKLIKLKTCVEYCEILDMQQSKNKIKEFDIILTTPLYYGVLCDTVKHVDRIIFDELDSVEFFANKQINYSKIWYISASFNKDIIGKTLKITDSISDDNIIKCTDLFIKNSFNIPEPNVKIYECYDPYIHIFEDTKFDMNKLCAMDYNNELKNLKKVAKNTKELIKLIMEDTVITIENCKYRIEQNERSERPIDCTYLRDQIRENENLLAIISNRLSITNCPICMEDFSNELKKIILSCCKNCFCSECIKRIIKNGIIRCPMCREDNNISDLAIITEPEPKPEPEPEPELEPELEPEIDPEPEPTKMECLENLLSDIKKKKFKKILIFSQYTAIFSQVITLLRQIDIKSVRFDDGTNINKINKIVYDFKNGDTDVLVLDTSMYAAGLNLEISTDVIFLHKTKNIEQVIGRAQRPGRTCILDVHKIFYKNEI